MSAASFLMPAPILPEVPRYSLPPPTSCDLEWADLPLIDLSKSHTPEGREALATEVRQALATIGFFYVINHGYTMEQTQRIFDIADIPFTQVDEAEKAKYISELKAGTYQGYKPRSYWHIHNGVRDEIDQYNLNLNVYKREHPNTLRPLLPEIAEFSKHNHFNILHPLLRLVARGLELPEEELIPEHDFEAQNDTWIRFMKYYPQSEENLAQTEKMWLKGHTDYGTLTILWSQPVSALQIRSPDGNWRWVKHMENALVINAGDWLETISGGYYKATIHRVIQPPPDQRQYNRLGVYYFANPNDDVRLTPRMHSPVVQRLGISDRLRGEEFYPGPTIEEFRKGRTSTFGQVKLRKGKEEGTEENTVAGVTVTHYL
ncbi:hypothetical protein M422DRAFT_241951 [Sphaerobolus stellatus SS14]|nr:hypothetical protein M422DRAFT_241951 [Sphaerobolus stellatus SS14]